MAIHGSRYNRLFFRLPSLSCLMYAFLQPSVHHDAVRRKRKNHDTRNPERSRRDGGPSSMVFPSVYLDSGATHPPQGIPRRSSLAETIFTGGSLRMDGPLLLHMNGKLVSNENQKLDICRSDIWGYGSEGTNCLHQRTGLHNLDRNPITYGNDQ